MSADNMVLVCRINGSKKYNVSVLTWPEVETIIENAENGVIQFTEFLTFKQAYKKAIKLFRTHHTEYGIMPIDLDEHVQTKDNEEIIHVFVIVKGDTIRIETIDRVRCRINNQEWDQDEKTHNLFIELTGTESELIKSKFSNYGYGIIYVKNNQISNVEVLFDA